MFLNSSKYVIDVIVKGKYSSSKGVSPIVFHAGTSTVELSEYDQQIHNEMSSVNIHLTSFVE